MAEEKKGNGLFWTGLLILGGGAIWAIEKFMVAPKTSIPKTKKVVSNNSGSSQTTSNTQTSNNNQTNTNSTQSVITLTDEINVIFNYSGVPKSIISQQDKGFIDAWYQSVITHNDTFSYNGNDFETKSGQQIVYGYENSGS
jgi:hypothetical protein